MKKYLSLITLIFLTTSNFSFSITVTLWTQNDVCNEGLGKIVSSVSGGIPPYTYLWSTGATTDSIVNLTAGTYTVTVYDSNGDSAINSTLLGSGPLQLAYTYSEASFQIPCSLQCNGVMPWNPNYIIGTPPFIFSPSSGTVLQNTPMSGWITINNICDGNLAVTVTDAVGCSGQINICFNSLPIQNPTINASPACNSAANGSITVTNISNVSCYPWFWDVFIVNTQYQVLSMIGNSLSTSLTYNNISPGNYYLKLKSILGDQAGNCPQYFPFTIPDLGTNCSAIEGNVFVDFNSNCNFDTGEVNIPNTIIEFTPGPYYAYTNNSGDYSTNLPWGTYNINQILSNNLVQICPAQPTSVTLSSLNPNVVIDFADTSNIGLDVKAFLSHGQARPGFDFNYAIGIKNYSHLPSGLLTVTLDYDPLLSFVSANPTPLSTSPGQVVWQLNSLNNFQSTNTTVTLNVPANPALIGDTLIATINVSAANPETDLSNNSKTRSHIITGSFDPNEKHVTPSGGILPALNEWIDYTILFQNTGNDTAFNIVIIDTLDADLNVATFVPGAASHAYETELSGQGIVKFTFNDILLPDSIVDEPNSHGFVSFQIKAKSNLTHNTIISNTADIYFDFNPPITTNTVQNNIDLTLAITAPENIICSGEQTTLEIVNELQNIAWNWYSGSCTGALVGTGNSITVSPTSTTTYFVRDSAGTIPSNNCFFKTITVNPPVDVTTTVNLNVITANAAGAGYQWIDCNNNFLPIAGETNQSFTATSNGNYAVVITENGCTDTSACVPIIIIGETEINNSNDFSLYPNPTTGIITIEFNNKEERDIEIEITDVLGSVILNSRMTELKSEINLSQKAKGVYFIKVSQGEQMSIMKIVHM